MSYGFIWFVIIRYNIIKQQRNNNKEQNSNDVVDNRKISVW